MPYRNGQLPESVLAPITGGGRLVKEAAAAFMAMNAESERRFGVTLHPSAPQNSYRPLSWQQYYYRLYRSGRGNLAAVPGTSNHGWGLAVDFPTMAQRHIVDEIGERYGWAKHWSDAPSEWWHIKYHPGVWKPSATEAPQHATERDRIAVAQQLLRSHGYEGVPVDGKLTGSTVHALRSFQRDHRLEVTGKADLHTLAALRSAPDVLPPHVVQDHEPHEAPAGRTRRALVRRRDVAPAAPAAVHEHHHDAPPESSRPLPAATLPDGGFPVNRIVALAGPFIAILAGGISAWVGSHFPGVDIDTSETAGIITQGVHFVVGAVITWALHHKYLAGWQQWERGVLALAAAAPAPAGDPPPAYDPDPGIAALADAPAEPPDSGVPPPAGPLDGDDRAAAALGH